MLALYLPRGTRRGAGRPRACYLALAEADGRHKQDFDRNGGLRALAYNPGNVMRTLARPKTAEPWSLTSLRESPIKIGVV
jgi:hypothetical protein